MLIISILLAVALPAVAIWKTKEVPHSISSLVDLFDGDKRWLWSVWLCLVTFTLAPSLIESIPESWKVVGFAMLLCLTITAAMPLFDKEHEKWHDGFGIAAGVLSQICVLLVCPWWLLLWVVMAVLVFSGLAGFNEWKKFCDGKGLFFTEAACALALYGALFSAMI